jgi:hypothetical protein
VNWRSAAVAELVEAMTPTLPAAAVLAAVAADDRGYAVKLSDACPLDGRFEVGSITKTCTGVVVASLVCDGVLALDAEIGHWLDAGPHHQIDPLLSAGLGWALGPPGYLGHDGGTSGFRAMLGIRSSARWATGVFVNDSAARGLPLAVRRSLGRGSGDGQPPA